MSESPALLGSGNHDPLWSWFGKVWTRLEETMKRSSEGGKVNWDNLDTRLDRQVGLVARALDERDTTWHLGGPVKKFVEGAKWQRADLRTDKAVERVALFLVEDEGVDVSHGWPTNEDLGGSPAGDRDVEFKYAWMGRARAMINVLIGEDMT